MPTTAANPQSLPWRKWYALQRWRRRAKHRLRLEPLCAACLKRGRITPATIADHDPPHRGDWNAFRLGPLQSLCVDCHKGKWAEDARGYRCDIGDDGLPVDPKHPFNVRTPSTLSLSTAHLQNQTRDAHDDQHLADRAADIGHDRLMEHVPDEQRHGRDENAVHDAVGG